MGALVQADIGALLEQAGAQPRGNRHDCPKCGGLRTVTHTQELFHCHKCQWSGNTVTLAKELGLYKRLPRPEYRELQERRQKAHEAAEQLCHAVKVRRIELLDSLYALDRIQTGARRAGPNHPEVWNALALVYGKRPSLLAELTLIESGSAAELLCLLSCDAETRQAALERVLSRGGLSASDGRFVEVNP